MAKKTSKKTTKKAAGSKKTAKKTAKAATKKTTKKTTKKAPARSSGGRTSTKPAAGSGGRTTKAAAARGGAGSRGAPRSRVTRTPIHAVTVDDEDGQRRPSRAPRPARDGRTATPGPADRASPTPTLPAGQTAPRAAVAERPAEPERPVRPSGADRPRGERGRPRPSDNGAPARDDRGRADRGHRDAPRARAGREGDGDAQRSRQAPRESEPKAKSEASSGEAAGRDRGDREPERKAPPPAGSAPVREEAAAAGEPPRDETIFDQSLTFEDFDLVEDVLDAVQAEGFVHPTVIQAMMIPVALEGKDVLGQAKTGTGKTAAFGLPILSMIDPGESFSALILAPTRELALQITAELRTFGTDSGLTIEPVYGGDPIDKQARRLERKPEIIVGTPGRVMDMERRGHLRFDRVRFAVLDEVDRMLDIGFREDIRRILGACPSDRQTIFVSATLTEDIEKLARRYTRDPEKLIASAGSLTVSVVEQHYISVQPWDKKRLLLHLLRKERPALTVVFCRLKRVVDELEKYLQSKSIDAVAIHGDMRQSRRNTVMTKLRSGKLAVLIASDLASRGIDVENISHVINYDLPEDPDLYVHRIGRTARAGRGGVAWSLVTPEQGKLLTEIENRINAVVPELAYDDFEPGPEPDPVRQRREEERKRAEQAKSRSRLRTAGELPKQADPTKFPGGVVPTKLPPRRLQGRVARR